MRKLRITAAVLSALLFALYVANASWLARPEGRLSLLAHRGVHQQFSREGLTRQSCTAERSLRSGHPLIENTIPSIAAAFALGADVVEIDVQATSDGDFAVFHDHALDCRTDGSGTVGESTMGELKQLDVAYGYTFDGGLTHPLRGSSIGMMPSLGEVLSHFPESRFLIDIKSNDPEEADRLNSYLRSLPATNGERLAFYGGWRAVDRLREIRPDLMAFSKARGERCLKGYMLSGWFGRVPRECHDSMIIVPTDYAWLLWGWPNRFLLRMQRVNSEVYAGGDADFELRSVQGLDDPRLLDRLPSGWRGGVFTDRIEIVGPALGRRAEATRTR